jgi:hypothetical protein
VLVLVLVRERMCVLSIVRGATSRRSR